MFPVYNPTPVITGSCRLSYLARLLVSVLRKAWAFAFGGSRYG
uniref:Uncharacterized protein n=1 Tax=Ciona intestinalis TaxID=7719 RepID=H2XYS0_CIOIN